MAHHQVFTTASYVWTSRDRLGYGATGSVYIGHNRTNGDRVAIKVFKGGPEFKSLKREIDVVRSLPHHENIVALYTVEEEQNYHNQVIVMELCTGGSLYDVIDSPENAYGLWEAEFKQVIYDVAKGLQHLRTHNFIHRDIKPGNIMRCQKPDGSYVFKLADFGTARELGPDETFISLYGTEEYLFPGLYERALVNPGNRTKFSAKVDLWSVGATFFHAATGRLPFQPFRKRDDKGLMFRIISEKKTGMVSGWQLEPNGKIIYSAALPKDTRLSIGMKLLITPLLSGLLENDFTKMTEFDDVFKEIEKINRKKVIDVFCVYSCTCHKVFIDPDDHDALMRLKTQIEMQTGLEPNYQELFFENLPYQLQGQVPASKLPTTSPDKPMFVFGGQPKKTSELETPTLPFPPSIPKGFALGSDVDFAKECAKVVHYYRFIAEQIDRLFKLMHQAAICYRYTAQHELSHVEQSMQSAEQLNLATCKVLESQIAGLRHLRQTLGVINQHTSQAFQGEIAHVDQELASKQELQRKLRIVPPEIRQKLQSIVQDPHNVTDNWDEKYCEEIFHRRLLPALIVNVQQEQECNETIQFMVKFVDNNYRQFQKERKLKGLTPHDQSIHEFNKTKIHSKLMEAQEKVVSWLSAREQVYTKLGEWFVRMIPLRNDTEKLDFNMKRHVEECNRHLQAFQQWETTHVQWINGTNQKLHGVLFSLRSQSNQPPPQTTQPMQIEMSQSVWARLEQTSSDLERMIQEQRIKLERFNTGGVEGASKAQLVA